MVYSFPKAAFVPGTTIPAKGISYLPVDVTSITNDSTAGERFSMFYPLGKPADYGWTGGSWPVVAYVEMLGFASSDSTYPDASDQSIDGTLFQWQCLSRGIAWAHAQVAVASAGKAYAGRGFFNPPGSSTGFYEDNTKPQAKKDAMYFIQHLRRKAKEYQINPNAICLMGGSSGSDAALWPTLGPERRWDLGQGLQYEYSTIPNCYISRGAAVAWWEVYDQADAAFGVQFPDTAGGIVVAPNLAGVGTTGAESLQYQRAASAFGYMAYRPGLAPPMLMYAFQNNNSFKFGQPFPSGTETVANEHSIWNFAAIKAQFPSSTTIFVSGGVTNLASLGGVGGGIVDKVMGNFDTDYTLETNAKVPLGQWARGNIIDWLAANINTAQPWYAKNREKMRWSTMVNTTGRFLCAPNSFRRQGVKLTCTDPTNGLLWGEYAAGTEKGYVGPKGAANNERTVIIDGDGPVWVQADAATSTVIVEEV